MGRSHGFAWTEERKARVRALRASGMMYYQIAKQLSEELGIALTESQCSSVLTGKRKAPPAQPQPLSVSKGQPPETDRQDTKEPHFATSAPAVHTIGKSSAGNFLTIPDPQIPFHKRDALQFIERWRRHFSVPRENMLCAGDEVDAYFGSRFDHSPDATHTPNSEIAAALDELKRWYAMWPYMRLANSNHGQRWVKKALRAQIPSQLMSGYREVLQAPEGWRWADSWTIDGGKSRFMLEHGHNGPQGFGGLRLRPLQNGLNTIWGHQHANAGIAHVVTSGQQVYGMCVGSLIDVESYAFEYDRANQYKPWIGVGVILNGGTTPLLVPYEREAA